MITAAVIEAAVRVVPLPVVARLAGVSLAAPDSRDGVEVPALNVTERRAVWLAHAVMQRWPFGGGTCLRRSLIIGHLLRRHAPSLRIGLAREGGPVGAHAWPEIPGADEVMSRRHRAFEL